MAKEAIEEQPRIYRSLTRPRYGNMPGFTLIQQRDIKHRIEFAWMFICKEDERHENTPMQWWIFLLSFSLIEIHGPSKPRQFGCNNSTISPIIYGRWDLQINLYYFISLTTISYWRKPK